MPVPGFKMAARLARGTARASGLLALLLLGQAAGAAGLAGGVDLHGFVDGRGGLRTQTDPNQDQETLGELRLQLDAQRYWDAVRAEIRADFLYDEVLDDSAIDLETGRGWLDLREANLLFSPLRVMDVKAGRQILTWGTGDLLFINDLFPKDWQSFFIGRDVEYLKAPSDALFVSLFPSFANVDVAYTPRFDADRYISGERISFWNAAAGARTGERAVVRADKPDDWFTDAETALRVYRTLGGYEVAAYGYTGFWKSPAGVRPETGEATFPRLNVYGASLRGNLARGIAGIEAGYYDSLDDRHGSDPFTRNSEARFMAGYEQDLGNDLTLGAQYYLEYMMHHDTYVRSLPDGQRAGDEDRHVLTLRLTRQLLSQKLALSLFSFYSPSDQDAYLRPMARYKVTDNWLVTVGGNVFLGEEDHTFFGQFEKNNNLYAGARYSF